MRPPSELGPKIRAMRKEGRRPTHIARELGINIATIYYHTNAKIRARQIAAATQKRKDNKVFAVAYKGGACIRCGYAACLDALVFHHVDPYQKDFQVNGTHARARLVKELDKTVLLCCRCHVELHGGLWTEVELKKHGLTFIPAGLVTGRRILPPSKRRRRRE